MRVVIFCHSLRSDWNHGNAHFLRGVTRELQQRGHDVRVFEPFGGWSATNLEHEAGRAALDGYRQAYPTLDAYLYDPLAFDVDAALDQASLVLVHEWTGTDVVRRLGEHRRRSGRYTLLFHDTHHRSVSKPEELAALDLSGYDGVLAFGAVIGERYRAAGWSDRVWTWHEAADVDVFRPHPEIAPERDLVWIGNWGDDERTAELSEFLITPAQRLALTGSVFGVRYPQSARDAVTRSGLEFRGWTPNHAVPEVFARHRVTVHVPRGPYTRMLPGIPTIRVFEALACGIPLVSAPWTDTERLFTPGEDFMVARTGEEMAAQLRTLLADRPMAAAVAARGRETVLRRHTCAHRVDELLGIVRSLSMPAEESGATPAVARDGTTPVSAPHEGHPTIMNDRSTAGHCEVA